MQKFSVLMSVYKNERSEYLKQAIESILTQSLLPNEIVIVKDGILTRELDLVIKEYQETYKDIFKIVSFSENRGLGLALRDGVVACTHEYIARMDTDDICEPDRFEKQFAYLKKHPQTALIGTWIKEFSKSPDDPDTLTNLPCNNEEIIKFAKKRNPFRHMTVIFKKQAVLDSGNYRDFLWFEDYDLWVRVIQKDYEVANIPEYLVNVRADGEMFARRGGWKYLKQEMKFLQCLYQSRFITAIQFAENMLIRSVVRLIPNEIRKLIYQKMLRKQK